MTPQVRLKRLKVWHLSTGPAAWMLTSMWCDTHRHAHVRAPVSSDAISRKRRKKPPKRQNILSNVWPEYFPLLVLLPGSYIYCDWLSIQMSHPFFLALIGLRIDVFLQFTWHNYHQLDFFDLLVYFLMQCEIFHLPTEPPHNFLFIFSFVFHLRKGRRLCRLWQKLQVQGN